MSTRLNQQMATRQEEIEGAPVTTAFPPQRERSALREIVETVVLALLIFVVVRIFVGNFQVDGPSMLPTFENGERIMVNQNAYRSMGAWDVIDWIPGIDERNSATIIDFGDPQRGDVIVFTPPEPGLQEPYIKRVIAVPGDEVVVHEDAVYVNGLRLEESYIDSPNRCDNGWTYCGDVTTTVPEGSVYVMGDNRTNSEDSRFFGPVPQENIIGKAWLVYWPSDAWGTVDHENYPGLQP